MMEDNQKSVVWLVDENEHELDTNAKSLRRILPSHLEVKKIVAFPHLEDYLLILNNYSTKCIITDQRLKVSGIANYTGIELAEYIRKVNSKIPIYILTNVATEAWQFEGSEWTVEDIIDKRVLSDESAKRTLSARIVRRINVYGDITTEREKRYEDLVKKSLEGNLEESELIELEEITYQKISPRLTEELSQVKQMERITQAHVDLIREMRGYLEGDDKNDK